jgi:hypothetical protein
MNPFASKRKKTIPKHSLFDAPWMSPFGLWGESIIAYAEVHGPHYRGERLLEDEFKMKIS